MRSQIVRRIKHAHSFCAVEKAWRGEVAVVVPLQGGLGVDAVDGQLFVQVGLSHAHEVVLRGRRGDVAGGGPLVNPCPISMKSLKGEKR